MKCEYKNCKEEANSGLRLADPDAIGNVYCKRHIDIAYCEIIMEISNVRRKLKTTNKVA